MFKKVFLGTLCAFGIGFMSSPLAHAEIVTGQAFINNGNQVKAKEDARREAMRSFVESKIGVKINSVSETENFVLVRDHVVAKSEGYVVVKKIISEGVQGPVYTITMDLEAGTKPIEVAESDVKSFLQSLDRNSSYASLDVVITDESGDATWDWSNQMVAQLKAQGFPRIKKNDKIFNFLSEGGNLQMNKLALYPELRRIGRLESTGAKSIVRGSLKITQPASAAGGAYVATAQASLEIIGYDSDSVDASFRYATAVGRTAQEAEVNARKQAVEEAVKEVVSQVTVSTQVQASEIETSIIFTGIYDRATDGDRITEAIENANCEIDRSVFAEDNSYRVAIYTKEYGKLNDVIRAIINQLRTHYPNAVSEQGTDIGATKTVIKLGAR